MVCWALCQALRVHWCTPNEETGSCLQWTVLQIDEAGMRAAGAARGSEVTGRGVGPAL